MAPSLGRLLLRRENSPRRRTTAESLALVQVAGVHDLAERRGAAPHRLLPRWTRGPCRPDSRLALARAGRIHRTRRDLRGLAALRVDESHRRSACANVRGNRLDGGTDRYLDCPHASFERTRRVPPRRRDDGHGDRKTERRPLTQARTYR